MSGENIYQHLTQLGGVATLPASPEAAVLERVPNPQAGVLYLVRFTAPEFTSLCPITGQPDFAQLVLDYVPGQWLVESKSLKLYLNSFNMEKRGSTAKEGIRLVMAQIKADLEKLLQTKVEVQFFDREKETGFDFEEYAVLETMAEMETITFESFSENPALLVATDQSGTLKVATHLLRSNCKITHQPDWGSAFIHIKANRLPYLKGLMQYLVSFRNENHFHEEICEMIYKRLWDSLKPEELAVTCIYTRRGGIDICPARASHPNLLPNFLGNPTVMDKKLLQQ